MLLLTTSLLLLAPVIAQQASPPAQDVLPDFDRLWNYSEPAETAKRFLELLPRARRSGDREVLGQLLTQIARTHGLRGEFVEAHSVLDEVQEMLEEAALPATRVRYLLERGRARNSSGEAPPGSELSSKQAAAQWFLAAFHTAVSHELDYHAIDAAHMLAIVLPPEGALRWHAASRRLAERSEDPRARAWLGPILNNLGWTLHDQEQYEKALEVFEAALALRQEQKGVGPILIARWSVARCRRSLGRHEEALREQLALEAEREKLGQPSGYVFEELGELKLALGDAAAATPYFAKAYELLAKDAWLRKHEAARLERLKRLGAGKD